MTTENPLWQLTASEVVERLYKREIHPLELIEVARARINAVNPRVNAVVETCFDRAITQAKAYTYPLSNQQLPGCLYGLPIAIKALTNVQGLKATSCSPIYANKVATKSDFHIQALERQGGIIIAQTNSPEFGAGGHTFNNLYGTTVNPWNTSLICGGSSGGSAVALATGEVWLADGSDYAGSLRLPAAYCGIVSLRPSLGLISTSFPANIPAVVGPMARNTQDLALMLNAMSCFNRQDPRGVPTPSCNYQQAIQEENLPKTLYWSPDLDFGYIDPETKKICQQAVNWFVDQGAELVDLEIDFSEIYDTWLTLRGFHFSHMMIDAYQNHRDQIKPELLATIEHGLNLSAYDIIMAQQTQQQFYQKLQKKMMHCDAILTPTVVVPPFDINTRYLRQVGPRKLLDMSEWLVLTWAITLTQCPALSIPCGYSQQGLPVGLQIVTKPYTEYTLLQFAHAYEQAHPWHQAVPCSPVAGGLQKAA